MEMWMAWMECWFMEEDEIINPFHGRFNAMVLQNAKASISNGTLNSTSSSQAFDGGILYKNLDMCYKSSPRPPDV